MGAECVEMNLVSSSSTRGIVCFSLTDLNPPVVYVLDSEGDIVRTTRLDTPGLRAKSILASRDVDNDGDEDVLLITTDDDVVFLSNQNSDLGTSGFDFDVVTVMGNDGPMIGAAGFVNGDALIDLVLSNSTYVLVKLAVDPNANDWTDVVASDLSPSLPVDQIVIQLGDMDGDGFLDLVSLPPGVAGTTRNITWAPGDGTGAFDGSALNRIGTKPTLGFNLEVVDAEGDGDLDVVFPSFLANGDGVCSMWYENGGAGLGWTAHDLGVCSSKYSLGYAAEDPNSAELYMVFSPLGGGTDLTLFPLRQPGEAVVFPLGENLEGSPRSFTSVDRVLFINADGESNNDLFLMIASDDEVSIWFHNRPSGANAAVTAPAGQLGSGANGTFFETDTATPIALTITTSLISTPSTPSSYPIPMSALEISAIGASGIATQMTLGGGTITLDYSFEQTALVFVSMYGVPTPGSPYTVRVSLLCEPGFQASRGGDITCIPCDEGTYGLSFSTASPVCTSCPLFTSSPEASISFLNCTCVPGTWFGLGPRAEGKACISCPVGGVCLGGQASPVADRGFYEFPPGSGAFVPCIRSGCRGANRCEIGYEGFLCSTCSTGYYSKSPLECEKCPGASLALFTVGGIVAAAVAVVAAGMVLYTVSRSLTHMDNAEGDTASDRILAFRKRVFPLSAVILVVNIQIVVAFSDATLNWTSTTQSMFVVLGWLSLDSKSVASECTAQSFSNNYILSTLLPLLMVLITVILVLVASLFASYLPSSLSLVKRLHPLTLVDSTLFTLAPILYVPTAKATLVLFGCRTLADGTSVLTLDSGVACYDSTWYSLLPLGLSCTVVYVLGLPAYFGFRLFANRHTLTTPATILRYGPLYRNFRLSVFVWELANLGKRLCVVCVIVIGLPKPLISVVLLSMVMATWTVMIAKVRPYFEPRYNDNDAIQSLLLVFLLIFGAASYAERDADDASSTFLTVGSIACVVALLGYGLFAIAVDIQSLIQESANNYSSFSARHAQLSHTILSELDGIRADDESRRIADALIRSISRTGRLDKHEFGTEIGAGLTMVQLEDLPRSPIVSPVGSPASSLGGSSSSYDDSTT